MSQLPLASTPLGQAVVGLLDADERVASQLVPWRRRAEGFLRDQGFPGPKEEHWRFTPLRETTRRGYMPPRGALVEDGMRAAIDRWHAETPALRLWFIGGSVHIERFAAGDGLRVESLAERLEGEPGWLHAKFGEPTLLNGFVALNAALGSEGIVVTVPKGVVIDAPIQVVSAHPAAHDDATLALPQLWVVLEESAGARLVEIEWASTHGRPSLTSATTRIRLEPNAELEHVHVKQGAAHSHSVSMLDTLQLRDSRYRSHCISLGGALSRVDLRVRLAGSGAECSLDGLYFAGEGELVDQHTYVEHAEGGAQSQQRYRGMADGNGQAVFDGTVIVRRDAQRTTARQENRNLLLSPNAIVHTKPHLEIDADDVVCSHGATVGQLDPNEVFYLRSRGLDESFAKAMLSYSFVNELLQGMSALSRYPAVIDAIRGRLPHGERLGEWQ